MDSPGLGFAGAQSSLWPELCRAEGLNKTYLNQDGKESLVLGWAAPGPWVFPVNVQPIKLMLAQEFDDRLDEGLAVLGSGNHCGEPRDAEQERVGVWLVPLPPCSSLSRVPLWEGDGLNLLGCPKIPSSNRQEGLQFYTATNEGTGTYFTTSYQFLILHNRPK